MDLLLKSEQIKPVKFRIVSDNVQCADFQMLKDHFSITDLQKVNDSRLYRWLISVGETELAEKVKETYPTPESIDKDAIGFMRLFFDEELKEFTKNSDLLYHLRDKHYSIFFDLIRFDKNLCSELYNSQYKDKIDDTEWQNLQGKVTKVFTPIKDIQDTQANSISVEVRGFDIVEELLNKIWDPSPLDIPDSLKELLRAINYMQRDINRGVTIKNQGDSIHNSEYAAFYNKLHKSVLNGVFSEINTYQTYYEIYTNVSYFSNYRNYEDYYSREKLNNIFTTINDLPYNSVNHDTYVLLTNLHSILKRRTISDELDEIPNRYSKVYKYIYKWKQKISSMKDFKEFLCLYLSTVPLK